MCSHQAACAPAGDPAGWAAQARSQSRPWHHRGHPPPARHCTPSGASPLDGTSYHDRTHKRCALVMAMALACAAWQRPLAFRALGARDLLRKEKNKKKRRRLTSHSTLGILTWSHGPSLQIISKTVCPFIFQGRGCIAYIRFIKGSKDPQTDRSQN